ncbi:MAG: hypothetical protein AVDCRST_MAG73-1684 [uncultured Thermomicrobiales bacterium]|uniref:Uncharacterized protein n=1 Tax=uncultured Thermomicrobiales bacterium TaxID=1645740 RepID=A0A6J4U2J2_9BACT|nr:MAG: hypothetical protein AVDCRST_MAG73-1684 [uncultured Thermomicrobiales bacterium]
MSRFGYELRPPRGEKDDMIGCGERCESRYFSAPSPGANEPGENP